MCVSVEGEDDGAYIRSCVSSPAKGMTRDQEEEDMRMHSDARINIPSMKHAWS